MNLAKEKFFSKKHIEKLNELEFKILCNEEIKELNREKEIAMNKIRELSEECKRLQRIVNDNKFEFNETYYKEVIYSLTNRINTLMTSKIHE